MTASETTDPVVVDLLGFLTGLTKAEHAPDEDLFAAGGLSGLTGWLGFLGIFLFTAGFNFGFGSLVWVYASESFPARLRTTGASAMLTADLVANLIIGLYFLSALESLGGVATFAMFAALAALSFGFVWWNSEE